MSWTLQTELIAPSSDPELNAAFGSSVAVYGDRAIIGSAVKDVSGVSNAGKAYIYVRSGTSWSLEAQINPPQPSLNNQFGWEVAIYEDTVLVSERLGDISGSLNIGRVYVYIRSGSSWILQQELIPSDPQISMLFGNSLSIYQNTTVIGAPFKDISGIDNPGSAYVFVRTGSIWTQQAILESPVIEENENFGVTVSIYENTIAIGGPLKDISGISATGKAYVYIRSGTSWTLQQEIEPPELESASQFGRSVSVYQDTLLIGHWAADVSGISNAGKAYVYIRVAGNWSLQQELVASDYNENDFFGFDVSLYNNTAIVSSYLADISGIVSVGAVYIFTRTGTIWTQEQKLVPSDEYEVDSQFGRAVYLYDNTIIAGASNRDISGILNAGKVYIYSSTITPPEPPIPSDLEQKQALEEQCICSQKACAQLSYTGITESDKITNIADNRTIATSYIRNNTPYNVRGRQFLSYSDYIRYQQAQLKFY